MLLQQQSYSTEQKRCTEASGSKSSNRSRNFILEMSRRKFSQFAFFMFQTVRWASYDTAYDTATSMSRRMLISPSRITPHNHMEDFSVQNQYRISVFIRRFVPVTNQQCSEISMVRAPTFRFNYSDVRQCCTQLQQYFRSHVSAQEHGPNGLQDGTRIL